MYSNPFVCQLLAEERMKDAVRHNEQVRLIRTVSGSGKSWRWRLPRILALKDFLALFMRPQHKRITENTLNL